MVECILVTVIYIILSSSLTDQTPQGLRVWDCVCKLSLFLAVMRKRALGSRLEHTVKIVCVQIAIHLLYLLGSKTKIVSNSECNKILAYFLIWKDTWKKAAFRWWLKSDKLRLRPSKPFVYVVAQHYPWFKLIFLLFNLNQR